MTAWSLFVVVLIACSSPSPPPPPPPPAPHADAAVADAADQRYDPGALGATTFEVTGKPAARDHFSRGLLALHSFWYDEAIRQFDAAIAADPSMNMAYWGAAISRCKLLWGDDDLATARKTLASMPDPDHLSPRDEAWVLATVELVRDAPDTATSRRRFADAMDKLHTAFPDDESTTFLAIALLSAMQPDDPNSLAVRKRAAELAKSVFDRNPKHPGAAHYLIHAYDTPELAPLALPYARAYAKIAPAAFHARHMPAHIFVRLGMWDDAIASCRAAWDASVQAAQRDHLPRDHDDFHSLNWLVEMDFEVGHDKDAAAQLAVFGDAVRAGLGRQNRALYATQVASYMARTGEWTRVDELLAPLAGPAGDDAGGAHCGSAAPAGPSPLDLFEQFAVLEARARAAAALHDVAATQRLIKDMEGVREKLRPALAAMQSKAVLARQDETQVRHRDALIARARGDDAALLAVLRRSLVDADVEVGNEANPSGFSIREEIGDALARMKQFKAAAVEYAHVLEKQPRRAHSLLGLARATAQAGDRQAAARTYAQLLEQWRTADAGIPGLDEARDATRN